MFVDYLFESLASSQNCVTKTNFFLFSLDFCLNKIFRLWLNLTESGAHNERRKGGGKEREVPTHLIKNSKPTRAARVTKYSKRMRLVADSATASMRPSTRAYAHVQFDLGLRAR